MNKSYGDPLNQAIAFPRIDSAETVLFWKLQCGKYSRVEIIQGRKLLISYFLEAETIQGRNVFTLLGSGSE